MEKERGMVEGKREGRVNLNTGLVKRINNNKHWDK